MADMNRQWLLRARPSGQLRQDDFEYREAPRPTEPLAPGEMRIRNVVFLCAPTMRNWMDPPGNSLYPSVPLGQPVMAPAVGRVVESNNPDFAPGDRVFALSSWQDYATLGGSAVRQPTKLADGISFVDAMGLEKVDLMAYSFGAWIAGLYAAENPSRVRRFVSLHNPGLNKIVSQYHPVDDVHLPDLEAVKRAFRNDGVANKVYEEMNREGRVEAHTALLHVISDPEMREKWSLRHHLPGMTLPIFSADRDTGFVEGTVECARLAPLVRIMISPSQRPMPELVKAGKAFLLEDEIKPIGKVR